MQWESLVATAWPLVVQLALDATVVLGAAGIVSLAMRRSSAALRHGVWTVAVVGLLVLPLLRVALPGVPLGRLIPIHAPAAVSPVVLAEQPGDERAVAGTPAIISESTDFKNDRFSLAHDVAVVPRESRQAGSGEAVPSAEAARAGATAGGPEPPVAPVEQTGFVAWLAGLLVRVPWPIVLVGLWTAGAAWGLATFAATLICTGWLLDRAKRIDDPRWQALLAEMSARLDLRRPVAIVESNRTAVPSAAGWLRPRIILPADHGAWPDELRRVVLAHELTHVARRDVLWQALARAAAVFYWFHPLVWLARRRLRWEREAACDDAVLRLGEKPSNYARHLLGFAASLAGRSRLPSAAVAMATRRPIEMRIRNVLQPGLSRAPIGLRTAYVLVGVTSLVLLAVGTIRAVDTPEKLSAVPTAPVAHGSEPWRTEITTNGEYAFTGGMFHGVAVAPATEENGSSQVTVTHDLHGRDIRVTAVDHNGRIHKSTFVSSGAAGPHIQQLIVAFPGLPRAKVKEFRVESQPSDATAGSSSSADHDGRSEAGDTRAASTTNKESTDAVAGMGQNSFDLLVLGPGDKPVPNARVEVRMRPGPKRWMIHSGLLVKQLNYGALMKADDGGRLTFNLPEKKPGYLVFVITTDGYAPFWAEWDSGEHAERVPERYTARLDAGQAVGGIVVDREGKPVEGVEVHPSIEFKRREGDLGSIYIGNVLKTDSQGVWSFGSVPASMQTLRLEIMHPRYMPTRAAILTKEFSLAGGKKPSARIVLRPGITVTGTVTDELGQPIAGARVRTKFLNDQRETTTDESGFYHLVGCEPTRANLVVTAKGRAPELKTVKIEPEMLSVDFRLEPGHTIRVRVTDAAGKPIPGTRIFFQSWRGERHDYELGVIHQYTDKQGVWVWDEAPADAVVADICPPGGMTLARQKLVARDEEYVFTPPPALVIAGRVVDAKTKTLVERFHVVPGYWSSEEHMNWARGSSFEARGGTYRLKLTHPATFAHQVRIEAEGYLPAESRQIKSDEGSITVDFALEPAADVAATVLSPDGSPAKDAKIAMGIAGAQINVNDGDFQDSSTYCDRRKTDERGHFVFPPQGTPFQLVITHPTGYAHVKVEPGERLDTIRLGSWARVEGIYRVGAEPAAGKMIKMDDTGVSYGEDVPHIFLTNNTKTDRNGRFVFPRVAPGRWVIGRRVFLMVNEGATEVVSSHRHMIEALPGQTLRVDLGGSGRAVVGKLLPPAGLGTNVEWNFGLVQIEPKSPGPPPAPVPDAVKDHPNAREAWWALWMTTDEGKMWRKAYDAYQADRAAAGRFTATIARDGTFRVDDVPAGDYDMTVRLQAAPESRRHAPGSLLGMLQHTFTVPEMPGGRSDEPLDLGELRLTGEGEEIGGSDAEPVSQEKSADRATR